MPPEMGFDYLGISFQRETENRRGRNALLGFLFLKRYPEVIEAHLRRHGLSEDFLQRLRRLRGTVAGGGGAIDLCAAIKVISHGELRSRNGFGRGEGRERDSLPTVVADIEQAQILGSGAILSFGLHIDLPLAAEAVEVVNEI